MTEAGETPDEHDVCHVCGTEIDPDDEDGLCDECEAPHPFESGSADDEVEGVVFLDDDEDEDDDAQSED